MASPELLDVASLLAEISDEHPAGDPVPFTLRQQLDAARKEEEPHPDDPTQPAIPRKVDWHGLVETTKDLLTTKSKDLLVAARLTEALTREHGFAGLRDGLRLLHDLIDQCWEDKEFDEEDPEDPEQKLKRPRLYPAPEKGEGPEVRAGPFHWLSDPDRGARFPNAIRQVPVLAVDGERLSWMDRKLTLEGRGERTKDDFERAALLDENIAEDVTQTLEQLDRLDQVLNTRFEENAPGMLGLRQAVEDCNQLVQHYYRGTAPPPEEVPSTSTGADTAAATAPGGVPGRAGASRDDLYRQVSQIADLLERLEPHSPIPDLLRRAVELGRMPFRQLVRELVRDQSQLAEIRREFGIKDADGGS